MKYCKVRNVKSPQRGTPQSAGIDLFIPEDFESRWISPGNHVLIPSGLKIEIPEGYMLLGADKSSIATKGLIIGAKVIDADYQGELIIHLINITDVLIRLQPGMKIAQFILVPVEYAALEEVPEVELFKEPTIRGEKGFGSTGA